MLQKSHPLAQKSALSCREKLPHHSKTTGMCSGGVNYPQGNVVCHETSYFWTCVVELRKTSCFLRFLEHFLKESFRNGSQTRLVEQFLSCFLRFQLAGLGVRPNLFKSVKSILMLSFSTPNVICFNARIALKSQKCVQKKLGTPLRISKGNL